LNGKSVSAAEIRRKKVAKTNPAHFEPNSNSMSEEWNAVRQIVNHSGVSHNMTITNVRDLVAGAKPKTTDIATIIIAKGIIRQSYPIRRQ
jgi:hypothetical protein